MNIFATLVVLAPKLALGVNYDSLLFTSMSGGTRMSNLKNIQMYTLVFGCNGKVL